MEFLSIGEKLRKLRQQLDLEQDSLTEIGVSRNYISMIEHNKRELTENRAEQLTTLLRNIANEKGISLDVSDDYLMLTQSEEAEKYCLLALDSVNDIDEANSIYSIIKDYKLDNAKPKYYLKMADLFFQQKDYSSAFTYYLDSLESYKSIGNYDKIPYIYNRLGRCRSLKLDHNESLYYLIKAYEAALEHNVHDIRKIILHNMARAYIDLNNADVALNYIERYLELCTPTETFEDYIRGTILKAACYKRQQNYEAAINVYTSCVELFNDKYNSYLGYIYNNLGDIYSSQNLPDKALEYYDKAQQVIEKSEIERISHSLTLKAELYIKLGDYNEALLQIVQAIAYSKSFKDYEYLYKGYLLLEKIYTHTNNLEKLKQVYMDMLSILENANDRNEMMKIHAKLSIISIKENKLETSLDHLNYIAEI
jgi:tetratricopeptide (TPR) repeat protein